MDLSQVSTPDLEHLEAELLSGRLGFPLSRLALASAGLDALADQVGTMNTLGQVGTVAVISAVAAERTAKANQASLVWTGPELRSSEARDTAVVLADLFRRAESRVLMAGFAFDHANDLLNPLHGAMRRGVQSRIFADASTASAFLKEHWPFGPPFPSVFGFVLRAASTQACTRNASWSMSAGCSSLRQISLTGARRGTSKLGCCLMTAPSPMFLKRSSLRENGSNESFEL